MRVRPETSLRSRWLATLAGMAVLGGCLVADPDPAGRATAPAMPGPGEAVASTHVFDPAHGLALDLYRPPGPATPSPPVLVVVHGGGWVTGTRAAVPASLLSQVRRGFVVASPDYRLALADPFPAAVLDVKRAVRWLRRQPDLSASPIVVAGESAGGNLAVMAAVSAGVPGLEPEPGTRTEVRAAVSLDGPLDLLALQRAPWLTQTWFMDELPAGPLRSRVGPTIESGELVPAYLGCARAQVAPEPPHVDPTCESQVAATAPAASPLPWIDGDDPPVYLVCLAANALLPDCAHDAAPFAVRYVAAHGGDRASAWLDPIEDPAVNHFVVDGALNQGALDAFLDWFRS